MWNYIDICYKCQSIHKLEQNGHWGAFMQPFVRRKIKENYIFWVCVCRLRYLVCNAHAPYCNLWPARLRNIFPPYPTNGTIFGKVVERKMRILIFAITYTWNIFHSQKNSTRYDHRCTVLNVKCPLLLSGFNETWTLSTDIWKIFQYQISWISVQWDPSCHMWTGGRAGRQAHRRTDRTKLIIASRNFADAPENEHGQYISTISLTYVHTRTYIHTHTCIYICTKIAYIFTSAWKLSRLSFAYMTYRDRRNCCWLA
jgi:hypothetical protein